MGGDVGWVARLRKHLPQAIYELMELAYSAVAYVRLARAAKAFKPDVIYERYNLVLLAGVALRRRLGIPLLLEVNAPLAQERALHSGGLALPWLARWTERRAWQRADAVLPVTRVLANMIIEEAGVPEVRLHVIPNGINERHFASAQGVEEAKRLHGFEGRLVLGFTGFVREWHGVDRVVRWMATSDAPPNSQLVVVGDGPVRNDLEMLAVRLGLKDRVYFTGVIHRDQVPQWVAAFDIALQPAVVAYASPLKLMEYLVLGKAIVAPRTPNLLEVLADGENAIMFEAGDPHGLEAALTRLCADDALRSKVGAGARASIERQQLTWMGNARRVVALAEALGARA